MALNRTLDSVIGKTARSARILGKAIGSLATRMNQSDGAPMIETLEGRTLLSVPNGAYNANAASSLTGINVTWVDNSWDEKGFVVERRAWAGGYTQVSTVGVNGTSFWDSNVNSETQYTYRVTPFNDSGVGSSTESNHVATGILLNSAPVAAPVIAAPAVAVSTGQLSSPSNLSTFATSSSSIALSWANTSAGSEAGFKVERRTWSGAYACIATVGQGVTSYTDTAYSGGVAASTQYTYRVRAYDWNGDSGYSNESTAITPATGSSAGNAPSIPVPQPVTAPVTSNGLPTAPSALLATATASTTIALSWTSNSGGTEVGFKIERQTWSGGYAGIATVSARTTSFTDTAYSGGVASGTGYAYRVRAYNSVGDSAYSAESIAITPGTAASQPATAVTPPTQPVTSNGLPTAPSGLVATANALTTVALNWTSNSGAAEAGFKVERRTGGGAYAAIATVGAGVTSFTDTAYSGGVTPGTQYTYRVRAYNWVGDSAYSGESTATTPTSGFQGAPVGVAASSTWNPVDTTGYFTIGVYRQPVQSLAGWKARGINTVVAFYDNPVWMEEYINTSNALGLWQIRNPRQNIQADVGAKYLLAYSHPDEPDINGISNQFLAAEYAQWKSANPAVPVLVNVSGGDVLRPTYPANKDAIYQGIFNTSDWITSDVYPVTSWAHPQWIDKAVTLVNNGNDPYFSTIAFNNGNAADKIRQLTGGKKQFSYIETSFQNNSSGPSIGGRVVTPDEFRGESWDAIIHGSKGLIYFPQAFNPDVTDATPPAIVAEMTKTDALITSFGAVLNSGSDSSNNYANLPGGLEATWRDFGGHRYYFVLNDSHGSAWNQPLNLPGIGTGAVEVAGEGRSVFANGATISDSFTPYQLHVYRV